MLLSIANTFIRRPVLTTVCTVVILLLGAICIPLLPLDKLPEMALKQVTVTANYLGSDAKTTEENVTTVLERQINGTERAVYMSSQTTNNGDTTINVSFPTEMDRNTAQVLVQNNVAVAEAELPEEVNRTGVVTQKQSPTITIAYAFYSEKNEQGNYIYDNVFISNYVDRLIFDEIKRIEGVGNLRIIGERRYAMRIWLNPDALAARNLSAQDVINAISEQNIQVGAGRIGQQPTQAKHDYEIALRAIGRFTTPEEAEDIVVQVGQNGTLTRLKDVGRAEVGAQDYSATTLFDGAPSVILLAYQLPGSNAWNTANLIKARMAELEQSFPPGLKATVGLDNTLFVSASLDEAFKTLMEAIALVFLVIFIFLQDWRTTIIPALVIPVSLIGAMAFAFMFGFSLNQLTLFGVILATGLVVDDGIVVVEAIAAKLSQGMRPVQAAIDAMGELTGAIIATSVVLMAVFIPVTFFPGTTGIVYRQFALIIAFAIAISTFNALTFSPSMSAIIMRRQQEVHGPLGWFFGWFNRGFDWFKEQYGKSVEFLIRLRMIVIPIFLAGLIATGWLYQTTPQGFIPEEDQGYFFAIAEAPSGVSLNYTTNLVQKVTQIIKPLPEVEHVVGNAGFGFQGNASNKALFFVKLKDWEERPGADKSIFGLLQQINQKLQANVPEARLIAVNAPPVDGLGSTGGFEMYIQNRQALPMEALIDNTQKVVEAARKRPELAGVFTQFTFGAPMMEISIDREQAKALNVQLSDIFNTMQTYLGARYVNQYVLGGRLYRVQVQAEETSRSNPDDIGRLYVRSVDGNSVPLSNVVKVEQMTYPPIITHYNVYPSINIQGAPAPGYSTGQAMTAMEEVAEQVLQPGFGYAWTGTAFQEKASGGAAPIIFGLAFVMVFLVLAAQYESYVDPIIIMITVPLAILGAIGALLLRANLLQAGSVWPVVNNNIYAQVALVMLIGLASKNAILIVEFANQSAELGMSYTKAAIRAAEERLRPILMTAISGLVGFWPLVIAAGAGAMSRWSLGTALFGGYLFSTLLSLFLVPVLYVVIKNMEENFLKPSKPKQIQPKEDRQPQPLAR
ncbi:MAG: Efflux pump membrane transporter BepE [Chroococcidiopsis cubana SAG 39.79]|uniref:Multidrug efflux RND transporter permease subunit n=1 Tax=Chroococcidiopsis cubana SAG 39.79 TaxID=388085 RepID=A0AB37UJU3_9CYAN|nr:efflux RND transporter permease subunit [Chroococcidiopsis cubana]MDZ4875448.1 Efflux pump membrane transporter BepE [Chroococcidiopsis cubana SAG 39.79]PSB60482.1 hydrophobe/amphiphile efflux-1 family RND transporter [Chroococcidiopsis cubana CCALA 043]RUT11625.1 multidrug efflux RND transporter permease subunit [Chroococcidiopsis cubana SAG 39.79]